MLHDPPDIDIVRRSDRRNDPLDDRRLRAALASGEWVKVAPGAFARASEWNALKPIERHRLRVVETLRRMRGPVVVALHAAAALHDMDVLGEWPERVDVMVARTSGGRSSGSIRRHTVDLTAIEFEPFGRHQITAPAQTALDLARTLPHVEGVAAVDQAIRASRQGGALASQSDLLATLESAHPRRGDVRAQRAVAFADPLAANVRESQSRVVIARLGFPRPRLQERRILWSGRLVYGDFYFPSHDHWAELDGRGKYTSPEFGSERSAADIVIDEKNRENEIRREVRGFSRWEPRDVDTPRRLYDILTGDGLPSALPRP
jgi:hypothetical protein